MTLVVIRKTYRLDVEFIKFKIFETEEAAKQFCQEFNTPETDPYNVKYGARADIVPIDEEIGSGFFKEA